MKFSKRALLKLKNKNKRLKSTKYKKLKPEKYKKLNLVQVMHRILG